MNTNEILEMLRNGRTEQEVCADLTKMLNEAVQAKREEDERAAKDKEKIVAFNHIKNSVCDFLEQYYPMVYDVKMRTEIKAKEVFEVLDNAYKATISEMETLKNCLTKSKDINTMAEDAIKKFLRDNDL